MAGVGQRRRPAGAAHAEADQRGPLMRPLGPGVLIWLSLAPLAYGVLARCGVIAERWPAADRLAERFGPAAGLLPYACGTLLLAAPLLWWRAPSRRSSCSLTVP